MRKTEFITLVRHLVCSCSVLVVLLLTGCMSNNPSSVSVVSEQYVFAAERLGYFFIYREKLPDDLYGFSSPEALYESVDEPFTHYWNREAAERVFQQLTTTVQGGVGIRIDSCGIGFVTKNVFTGSPADNAGLRDGDTIIAVDGEDVAGLSYAEFISVVTGEIDTDVSIQIKRGDEYLVFEVTRGTYMRPSVIVDSINASTVVIELSEFLDSTIVPGGSKVEFAQALDSTTWAENTIIDLRGNGGGMVDQCIAIISELVAEETPIINFNYRDIDETTGFSRTRTDRYRAVGPGTHRNRKVYILVNGGTASASEIMTSCLMTRDEVTVIGSNTYGKARGQYIMTGPGGVAVAVTSMTFTPVNDSAPAYDLVGIEPDVLSGEEDAMDVALDLIGEDVVAKRQAGAVRTRAVKEPAVCDELRMMVVKQKQ